MTININFEMMPFNEAVTEFLVNRMSDLSKKHEWLKTVMVNFKREILEPEILEICEITIGTIAESFKIVATSGKISSATLEAVIDLELLIKNRERKFSI